jgi:hypothetical protein
MVSASGTRAATASALGPVAPQSWKAFMLVAIDQ